MKNKFASKCLCDRAQLQLTCKGLKEAVSGASDASERDRALVGAIEKVESQYGPVAVAIVELAAAGKRDEAVDKMNKECRSLLEALLTAVGDIINYSDEQAPLPSRWRRVWPGCRGRPGQRALRAAAGR